jgi:hypothetical protein
VAFHVCVAYTSTEFYISGQFCQLQMLPLCHPVLLTRPHFFYLLYVLVKARFLCISSTDSHFEMHMVVSAGTETDIICMIQVFQFHKILFLSILNIISDIAFSDSSQRGVRSHTAYLVPL